MADKKTPKKGFGTTVKGAWSKFTGGVDKTVQKAETSLESGRIRARIRELEQQNTMLYARMGEQVYRSAGQQMDRSVFAAHIRQIQNNYAEQQQLLLQEALLGAQQKPAEGDPPAQDMTKHLLQ